MEYTHYEDKYCYYIRKPANKPSTFWASYSFLEELRDQKDDSYVIKMMDNLKKNFTEKEEYWLLNRLDTPTTGLLYFAKTPQIKQEYKNLQKQGRVYKYYLLEVWWDIGYWIKKYGNSIDFPIAHHKFQDDRMVVLLTNDLKNKIKWASHEVKTKIEDYSYDKQTNRAIVLVSIQKWIRHQIRSHFSSIGYPILGDTIYGKKKEKYNGNLQLFSIGLRIGY